MSSENTTRRTLGGTFMSTCRSESPEASFIKLSPVIVLLKAPRSSEVNNALTPCEAAHPWTSDQRATQAAAKCAADNKVRRLRVQCLQILGGRCSALSHTTPFASDIYI
ncbi:hypothetical protein E2C01_036298 [Portunus trituberculatus]|uniref:Uncharacterized protein n=1 Tax=Portunus trituberculatus TaxID=210409 RepID=A0A5B7F8D2_PORTR|nr:hypothetical protein [Portunus trituberculatus]